MTPEAVSPELVVGVTADRRWQEQADLFRRRGIGVLHGPSLRTVELGRDGRLREVTESLVAVPPRWFVATTGAGMRSWFAAAADWGLREELLASLRSTVVVGRGAKVTSALRQAGVEVAWRAPGESMVEVVRHLEQDAGGATAGGRGAIQLFDPDDHPATEALRPLVDELVEVPLYRWLLPEDTAPAERLIQAAISGRLGAITFTSQPAVRFLFRIAEAGGWAGDLRDACNDGRVLPACIGAVCAEAAHEVGIEHPVWPEPFRLPPLVRLVAERLRPQMSADLS
ncbi:MAG: uroporphyrinogen-III synthase [Actinobacteria bacterium]|nr:uroporphyrinogen-III synthase [Actinomycetota bacterium]MBW3649150.1 uroporphyrinogen-III synthase [Actinomycetota bacterium]